MDWITTTYSSPFLCVPWKPLASVWVWPNPLRSRESNFIALRGVTPSQSYLFPNDLTQQVDHISFGGLAEDSWVGDIEPEWIKYGCQEKKSEMVPKDIGVMKCSGQGWGAFWGDWEKKRGWGDHVWNSNESTVIWESQADWHMPSTFLRAGTKPKKISENLTPIFILTFNRIFIAIFFLVPCPLFPHPAKGARDSECIYQRPTDPCVQLFWS